MDDEQRSSPATHWRKRSRGTPLPPGQAVRQGNITALALRILGKDEALAFLNTENAVLGGRPIALATESDEGQRDVEAELARLEQDQGGD